MIDSSSFKAITQRFDPARLRSEQATKHGDIPSIATLHRLCDHNLDVLTKNLGPLSAQEQQFMDAFKSAPWHVTHATKYEAPVSSEPHLMSLDKLSKQTGPGQEAASAAAKNAKAMNAIDIGQFGNDRYVYVALEAGEDLQKQASRFGGHLYRAPLKDSGIEQHGLLILHDLIMPETKADKHYRGDSEKASPRPREQWGHALQHWKSSGLDDKGTTPPAALNKSETGDFKPPSASIDRFFFRGKDTVQALGMAVLLSARMVDKDMQQQALSCEPENINKAANGIFRPQILIPNEFAMKQATRHEIRRISLLDP